MWFAVEEAGGSGDDIFAFFRSDREHLGISGDHTVRAPCGFSEDERFLDTFPCPRTEQ